MMDEEELKRIKAYIAAVKWQFAKTMPWMPHWYTLREKRPELDAEFVNMVVKIREHGYDHKFKSKVYKYYDIDGFHYWTMGSPLWDTILINRARIAVKIDSGALKNNETNEGNL